MAEVELWHDGKFERVSQASVPVRDLTVMRGYGIFDYFRTYHGGNPITLRRNLARLANSCKAAGIDLPYSLQEIRIAVLESIARNKALSANGEFGVRIVVTGGVSSDSLTVDGKPSVFVIAVPLKDLPHEWREKGVAVTTIEGVRALPQAKHLCYLQAVMGVRDAKNQGAVEAIYTFGGQVFEGTVSNFFAVVDGKLVTPNKNILFGVTRGSLIEELAAGPDAVTEREVTLAELRRASEIFLTASNKRVLPVVKLDGVPVGDGKIGPVTRRCVAAYDHWCETHDLSTL